MPDFVADQAALPAAKSDLRPLGANPATKFWAAADANATFDALRSLRDVSGQVFSVRTYDAVGDSATDDTDAFEEAFAKAATATQTVSGLALAQPQVIAPSGGYLQSRPLFLPNGVTLAGHGPGATVLAWKTNTWGYGLLAADSDGGANGVHVSGGALLYDYDGTDATKTYLDLAQYPGGRLPAGSWTIRLAFRPDDAAGSDSRPIFAVGALTPWSDHPIIATGLLLYFAGGSLILQYRYGNNLNSVAITTASYGVLSDGTWYEIELDYDDAAGTLRVFLGPQGGNAELWTLGAWTPGSAGDGTKFRMWAWERFTVGSTNFGGYPSESYLFNSALGALKGVHVSGVVRHTATFTAQPLTDPTADSNTRLLVKFDQTYLGHVVAKGTAGNVTVYLKPRRFTVTEHPRVQVRDLALLQGAGMRMEFASEGLLRNVLISYPDAGLELMRNCYFTHLDHVRVLNGSRGGVVNEGGAYNVFTAVNTAAPVGFGLYSANVTMVGCESAAHPGYALNLAIEVGTGTLVDFAVDNEENAGSTPWIASVVLADTATYGLSNPTIYNPPDKVSQSPILIKNTAGSGLATGYGVKGGFLLNVPTGTAFVKLVGDKTDLDQKIAFDGTPNPNSSPLCDVGGQAHDPSNKPRGKFQVSGVATTHQVDLPYAGWGTAYEVSVTPIDASAGASAGCTRVRKVAKSDDHFVVTVEAAPGGSETADFDYVVEVGT